MRLKFLLPELKIYIMAEHTADKLNFGLFEIGNPSADTR